MLRKVLLTIGVLLLLAAAVCAAIGFYPILPHLLFAGLLLTAGIGYERWRYKAARPDAPDPRWQATGERFVDPESGALTEVWYDPRSGERHYVKLPSR
ncbi:hypothetical protein [Solimonas terrae]|uniref:Uncharacterized protein n=1 Tax=Solimonas terrae TaxID=1396819 RepID=A0A6M2BSR2_9GAMM|nr:hypothetical protein [Solimonas terrae]NGY05672.1 hypothetical protein [Solimonas terrae]